LKALKARDEFTVFDENDAGILRLSHSAPSALAFFAHVHSTFLAASQPLRDIATMMVEPE